MILKLTHQKLIINYIKKYLLDFYFHMYGVIADKGAVRGLNLIFRGNSESSVLPQKFTLTPDSLSCYMGIGFERHIVQLKKRNTTVKSKIGLQFLNSFTDRPRRYFYYKITNVKASKQIKNDKFEILYKLFLPFQ